MAAEIRLADRCSSSRLNARLDAGAGTGHKPDCQSTQFVFAVVSVAKLEVSAARFEVQRLTPPSRHQLT
jgi:hypothetical protein